MNSCLYRCEVMHARLFPKKNWFRYKIFMFYLDLDELDKLHKKILVAKVTNNWPWKLPSLFCMLSTP